MHNFYSVLTPAENKPLHIFFNVCISIQSQEPQYILQNKFIILKVKVFYSLC